MPKHYTRLVELYVTPALRNKIKKMKGNLTYEEFLTRLIGEQR